jgi:superkiller protein 3
MRNDGPLSPAVTKCRECTQEGVLALEQGRWASAELMLSKAVDACPKDPDARRQYAEALWNRGKRPEAVHQLGKAIELEPANVSLRVRATEMRLTMGRLEEARREIEAALDSDPNSAAAWAMHARVLHASGDVRGALANYHRALGYAPEDHTLLFETAELYREQNRAEEALAVLHRLIDTYGPGEEPQRVLYLEGLAYAALDRPDEAAKSFTLALQRGPKTPEMLYQLAVAQSQLGRSREAVLALERALRLRPNHGPSKRLFEQLSLAQRGGAEAPR